ncbi:ChaN family lipoprotein [Oceaniglobus trochenteri]|uniref:ChaN family lipoprotein n=1 Tax=Oceaniglobus trochenteri TaxID=2763260 RepID=UPI001D0010C8
MTLAPDRVDLAGYDVVIMGEVHDNPAHHRNQAEWLNRLAPKAVVFEMLTPERADLAMQSDPDTLETSLMWGESGWPDFAIYAPVFAAVGDAAIIGGGVERAAVRAAVRDGAAAAMGDSASVFGLNMPLPRLEAETRQSLQAEAHCGALPDDMLSGMVEAQRLRDAALARAVVAAVVSVGTPVAVITGNGHARTDWGMPVALDHAMPTLKVLSIGQLETVPTHAQPHDALTLAPGPEGRGDPCAAFR